MFATKKIDMLPIAEQAHIWVIQPWTGCRHGWQMLANKAPLTMDLGDQSLPAWIDALAAQISVMF